MVTSSSSSSSYVSSSLGLPPYAQNFTSPVESTWTPNSAVSALSDETSSTPQGLLHPLDLGPPGYQATIVLFENTPDERTIYLGPWEVVGTENRRVIWQCSYQRERLEHFFSASSPAEIYPHTLHARHRQFSDPSQLEQFVTFRERHRVRYTSEDGMVLHDEPIEVKYEFTTVDASLRFQGDLRRKDLVDCFDVDVIWTDTQGRTDSFGNVRGFGTVQRLKVWEDRHDMSHTMTVYANRTERRYKEYPVECFEGEARGRDDRRRTLRLNVRGRRGSAPDSRRISFSSPFRPRVRSTGGGRHEHLPSPTSSISSASSPLDIRYLGIQFSRPDDYRRFLDLWVMAHSSESEFRGVSYPQDRFELPSPEIVPNVAYEMSTNEAFQPALQSVPEPVESGESDATP